MNNTYKALRLIGKNYNLYYSVWCTNEHELYDLKAGPFPRMVVVGEGKSLRTN